MSFLVGYRPLLVFKFPFQKIDDLVVLQVPALHDQDPERRNTERLYLTPIASDRQKPRYLAEFTQVVRAKAKRISDTPAVVNEQVLDLSYSLPTKDFAWRQLGLVNNHLAHAGREFVARQLALRIRNLDAIDLTKRR